MCGGASYRTLAFHNLERVMTSNFRFVLDWVMVILVALGLPMLLWLMDKDADTHVEEVEYEHKVGG